VNVKHLCEFRIGHRIKKKHEEVLS
jgi:hypothetical protein